MTFGLGLREDDRVMARGDVERRQQHPRRHHDDDGKIQQMGCAATRHSQAISDPVLNEALTLMSTQGRFTYPPEGDTIKGCQSRTSTPPISPS